MIERTAIGVHYIKIIHNISHLRRLGRALEDEARDAVTDRFSLSTNTVGRRKVTSQAGSTAWEAFGNLDRNVLSFAATTVRTQQLTTVVRAT